MLSKIEIEKYKMLISAMPEDKAIEATEMLKEAMKEGAETSKTLPEINRFVMKNANVYIVKDEKEIRGKDLTEYDVVMFDCTVKDVEDFSNCPKKMIFNESVVFDYLCDIPDLSESIVIGSYRCSSGIETLKGTPKYIGGYFTIRSGCLDTLENGPSYVGKGYTIKSCSLKSLEGCVEKVFGNFECKAPNLGSFIGGPKYVDGNFTYDTSFTSYGHTRTYATKLSSFEGLPEYIGGTLSIYGFRHDERARCIMSTSGFKENDFPKYVGGDFYCDEYWLENEFGSILNNRKNENKNSSTLPPNGFGNDGR